MDNGVLVARIAIATDTQREHPDSLDSDALLYFWRDLFGGY